MMQPLSKLSVAVTGMAVLALAASGVAPSGDYDADGDVALGDYSYFETCLSLSGPGTDPQIQECIDAFDFGPDGDIDLADFGGFQVAFTGRRDPVIIPPKTLSFDQIGIHDFYSENFDDDCIGCHTDRLYEVALDGVTPTAHNQMLRVLGQAPWLCLSCHREVDFTSQSAANLRRQVSLEENACTACHNQDSSPDIPHFFVR